LTLTFDLAISPENAIALQRRASILGGLLRWTVGVNKKDEIKKGTAV